MEELSLNVLDVVQNSIVAEADLIEISQTANELTDELIIIIKDNGKGMSPVQVEKVIDPFFTTRTTRKIGLGIPLFKQSAEMTGGSFSISSSLGVGTLVEAHYIASHIDCMPLGNMLSTISMLVYTNPNLNFVFTETMLTKTNDKKSFTFDTREIRNELGDVPLNDPSVNEWINEYLKEQHEILTAN